MWFLLQCLWYFSTFNTCVAQFLFIFAERQFQQSWTKVLTHLSKTNAFYRRPSVISKNRSAMRTWGLMLNFIPFGWNAVLKYQHLGVDLLQVKK